MLTIAVIIFGLFAVTVAGIALDLKHRSEMDSLHLKYARKLAAKHARGKPPAEHARGPRSS